MPAAIPPTSISSWRRSSTRPPSATTGSPRSSTTATGWCSRSTAAAARAFTRSHADWSDRFAPCRARARGAPGRRRRCSTARRSCSTSAGVSRFELLQKALGEHPETRRVRGVRPALPQRPRPARPAADCSARSCCASCSPTCRRPRRCATPITSSAARPSSTGRRACRTSKASCASARTAATCRGAGATGQKVKCRQTQEFVVGGFTEGAGSRARSARCWWARTTATGSSTPDASAAAWTKPTVASLRARLDALERTELAVRSAAAHHRSRRALGRADTRHRGRVSRVDAGGRAAPAGLPRRARGQGAARDRARSRPRPTASADDEGARRSRAPPEPRPPIHVAARRFSAPMCSACASRTRTSRSSRTRRSRSSISRSYYAAIAPLMLAEVAERPLTLVRCPVGDGRDCFYQRHPDAGLPAHVHRLAHTLKGEPVELLYVDSAEGLVALAQMGVGEIHTWLSRIDAPTRPDRIVLRPRSGSRRRLAADLRGGAARRATSARRSGSTAIPQVDRQQGAARRPADRTGLGVRSRPSARKGDRRPARGAASRRACRQDGQERARRPHLLRLPAQRRGRERGRAVLDAHEDRAVVRGAARVGRAHRRPRHPRVHARRVCSSARPIESTRGANSRTAAGGAEALRAAETSLGLGQ